LSIREFDLANAVSTGLRRRGILTGGIAITVSWWTGADTVTPVTIYLHSQAESQPPWQPALTHSSVSADLFNHSPSLLATLPATLHNAARGTATIPQCDRCYPRLRTAILPHPQDILGACKQCRRASNSSSLTLPRGILAAFLAAFGTSYGSGRRAIGVEYNSPDKRAADA
jgi:hypothetical protein